MYCIFFLPPQFVIFQYFFLNSFPLLVSVSLTNVYPFIYRVFPRIFLTRDFYNLHCIEFNSAKQGSSVSRNFFLIPRFAHSADLLEATRQLQANTVPPYLLHFLVSVCCLLLVCLFIRRISTHVLDLRFPYFALHRLRKCNTECLSVSLKVVFLIPRFARIADFVEVCWKQFQTMYPLPSLPTPFCGT